MSCGAFATPTYTASCIRTTAIRTRATANEPLWDDA
jgi:hypothetical protein